MVHINVGLTHKTFVIFVTFSGKDIKFSDRN